MYSMLRVKDRLKSVELFTQINEEEATFAQLASVYSEGVEKSVNGLIGPLELGILILLLLKGLELASQVSFGNRSKPKVGG